MMNMVVDFLRHYPQIVIFSVVGLGYFVGRIKIFNFSLGATTSILIIALILGQINIQISALLPTIAFALFIFCIGYKVGPEFFSSLKSSGIKYIFLSIFVCLVALVMAVLLGKLFHFNAGLTAGMLGGSMTQSSIVGTATDAISHLSISSLKKSVLNSDVAVAYAITYIFGTVGLILFYRFISTILRIDLPKQARFLEQSMGSGEESKNIDIFNWSKRLSLRVYQLTNSEIIGKKVSYLEDCLKERMEVEKIKRKGKIIEPEPNLILEKNDLIAITAKHNEVVDLEKVIGKEQSDKDLLNVEGEILRICVLKKIVGKKLSEIDALYGKGLLLRRIWQQGHLLPLVPDYRIKKCDVIEVSGAKLSVENFVKDVGYPERSTGMTDLVMVGFGCALGTLLGLVAVHVGSVPITLGIGGGVLVMGLIFGWLRSLHPTFGYMPDGAQWLFTDFGLNFFIACVGLTAAPRALSALHSSGFSIFFVGALVTLLPTILGLLFGRYVLKLNIVLLLGGLIGAGTITAALNTLKQEAKSSMPAIGYTVPYAFSNVLLTIWGTVVINLMV